jgi:hypothetical protein
MNSYSFGVLVVLVCVCGVFYYHFIFIGRFMALNMA